jgi:2-polyprenyl-3-methyl-5-hydroxy-6-metoxy-1,4-benzoquinol methylase
LLNFYRTIVWNRTSISEPNISVLNEHFLEILISCSKRILSNSTEEGGTVKEYVSETFWETAMRTKMGAYLTRMEMGFFLKAIDFPTTKMVCDVGAGAGKFTLRAAEEGAKVVALDIDLHGLGRLKAKNGEVDVIRADARALPLRDNLFDAAVSMEVVDYIPELEKVLAECKRILKTGCPFVFSFGNLSSLKSKARQLSGKNYMHSYGEAIEDLRETGFDVDRKMGFNWLPFNRTSENEFIPFLAKVERTFGLRRLPKWSPWVLIKAVKAN